MAELDTYDYAGAAAPPRWAAAGDGEDDEPLDEERGDYKAFDGPPAAGSTEKRPASTGPNVPGNEDARQASLKKLKDRGWNT